MADLAKASNPTNPIIWGQIIAGVFSGVVLYYLLKPPAPGKTSVDPSAPLGAPTGPGPLQIPVGPLSPGMAAARGVDVVATGHLRTSMNGLTTQSGTRRMMNSTPG